MKGKRFACADNLKENVEKERGEIPRRVSAKGCGRGGGRDRRWEGTSWEVEGEEEAGAALVPDKGEGCSVGEKERGYLLD